MAAEELAANQRAAGPGSDPVARDVARWATALRLTPVAMSAISVSFGAIAAVWLTSITVHAQATAFAALAAAFVTGRAGRLMGGRPATTATEWGQAACAFLTEVVVYAGIAGGATANAAASAGTALTGPVGERLRDTSVAGLGEPGITGVWRLAVAAVIALALLQMADMCLAATPGEAIRARRFGVLVGAPGDWRLLFIGGAVLLAGARGTFLLLLVLAVLALGAMLVGRSGSHAATPVARRVPRRRAAGGLDRPLRGRPSAAAAAAACGAAGDRHAGRARPAESAGHPGVHPSRGDAARRARVVPSA